MSASRHTSGDPRRPQDAKPFDRGSVNIKDTTPLLLLLITAFLGFVGMLNKSKLAAWPAVVCAVSAVVSTPQEAADYKHAIFIRLLAILIAVIGLIVSYVP